MLKVEGTCICRVELALIELMKAFKNTASALPKEIVLTADDYDYLISSLGVAEADRPGRFEYHRAFRESIIIVRGW